MDTESLLRQSVLDELLKAKLTGLKERHEASRAALENGKQAQHDAALKALKERLRLREEARAKQLTASGMNKKDSELMAKKEYNDDNEKQINEYEKDITKDQNDVEKAIEVVIKNKINTYKKDHEKDNLLIPLRIENERELLERNLKLHLAGMEIDRVEALIGQGMTREEAQLTARSDREKNNLIELKAIEENLKLKKIELKDKLKSKLDFDLNELKELERHARKTLEDGLLEHRLKEQKRLRALIEERRRKKELEFLSAGTSEKSSKNITTMEAEKEIITMETQLENELERALRLLKEAQKVAYENRIIEMKGENEKKCRGLESFLNFKCNEAQKKLKEKLLRAKVSRERQLIASGLSTDIAAELSEKDFGPDSIEWISGMKNIMKEVEIEGAMLKDIAVDGLKREKEMMIIKQKENADKDDKEGFHLLNDILENERESLLKNYNTSKAIFDAAKEASKYSENNTINSLKNYREEYERELKRLQQELLLKKIKEEKALNNRLSLRKKNRILELIKSGMTEKEAEKKAEEENEEAYHIELNEINMKLNTDHQDEITKQLNDLSEKERMIISKEHNDALTALNEASESKSRALRKLELIRREEEEENKKFEESMKHARTLQEDLLKKRLNDKKLKKMKKLTDSNCTEQEKQEEIDEINKEEIESMIKMKFENEEDEELKRINLRKKYEKEINDANESVIQAELESTAAKAKESAIAAVRNAKIRADHDLHSKELQRMKDQHSRLEEAAFRDMENSQAQGKGKLQDRLNAKRLRKEIELATKEQKERSDLIEKQEKEEEERETLKKSKINWQEKLKICFEFGEKNRLNENEFEEYCLQELFVKEENLVPITQLNEVIGTIQGKRHRDEMLSLLNNHFEERILAIKLGIETVLNEKSTARTNLLQKISTESLDDVTSKDLSLELEKNFNMKQYDVEKKIINRLEPTHTKQQMDLRQKQLENIAKIVALYTTPDNLIKLQEIIGVKSQVEEMAEYRFRLENDKKIREENNIKERNLNEIKLREEMAEELIEMQKQFKTVQQLAEKEYDDKKIELLKQREELELKHLNEKSLLNQQEKNRILNEFEKEKKVSSENLENSKKNQKTKLNERLATKRRSKASLFDGNITPEMLLQNNNTGNNSLTSSNLNVFESFSNNSNIKNLTMDNEDNNSYDITMTDDKDKDKDKDEDKLNKNEKGERNLNNKLQKHNNKKNSNSNSNSNDNLDKMTLASMKMIESKLEHIERMIVAIEVKAAVVDTLSSPRGTGSPRKSQILGNNFTALSDTNTFSNNDNNNDNNNNNNPINRSNNSNFVEDFNLPNNFYNNHNNSSFNNSNAFNNMSNITTGTIPQNIKIHNNDDRNNLNNDNNNNKHYNKNYDNNSDNNNYSNDRYNENNRNNNLNITNSTVFKDLTEPQSGMEIQVLPDIDMTAQDKVRLEYGLKLAAMIGLPELKIIIAVELPESKIINNSFSNSYYYDDVDDKLYIHSNRLVSSGDFGLVVIHALSHIKVREKRD